MESKTILIDMDSIIVDIEEKWYGQYNATFGDNLTTEKIKTWDLDRFCKPSDQVPHPVFSILAQPGFFLDLPALPGALEGLRRLSDGGHNVMLVTSPPNIPSMSDKATWIKTQMPWFNVHKNLILTYQKNLVKGDILFDDGPHNITRYRQAWPNAAIATIAYPYNESAQSQCDLVTGTYLDTAAAWDRFCSWVEAGALRK